jgi:hypothetical protein
VDLTPTTDIDPVRKRAASKRTRKPQATSSARQPESSPVLPSPAPCSLRVTRASPFSGAVGMGRLWLQGTSVVR